MLASHIPVIADPGEERFAMPLESQGSAADDFAEILRIQPSMPLPERVYETLEKSIVDGILRPGMHLIEDDIARRLGVSRNPVRQALQRLAHEGFVHREQGRGAFVHFPSPQEINDIFHVRALLESDCARLAAERITNADLEELNRILSLGRSAVDVGDPGQLLELNDRFHGIIVRAANNPIMERLMIGLRRRIRWYFSSVVVARSTGSWHEHEEIYHALLARDAARCAAVMNIHVGQTLETIQADQPAGITSGGAM